MAEHLSEAEVAELEDLLNSGFRDSTLRQRALVRRLLAERRALREKAEALERRMEQCATDIEMSKLEAENERLRESDARWSVFAEECGKERTILEDQRDEARRELATMRRDETRNERDDLRLRLAEALFREGKACLARDAAEEELEAVREECQHEREAKVAAQFQVEEWHAEVARLRADFLRYALDHEDGCEDGSASGDPCTCGLDAARARWRLSK